MRLLSESYRLPTAMSEGKNDYRFGPVVVFLMLGKAQQPEKGDHFFKTPALRRCSNSIGADRCRGAQMIRFLPLLRFTKC